MTTKLSYSCDRPSTNRESHKTSNKLISSHHQQCLPLACSTASGIQSGIKLPHAAAAALPGRRCDESRSFDTEAGVTRSLTLVLTLISSSRNVFVIWKIRKTCLVVHETMQFFIFFTLGFLQWWQLSCRVFACCNNNASDKFTCDVAPEGESEAYKYNLNDKAATQKRHCEDSFFFISRRIKMSQLVLMMTLPDNQMCRTILREIYDFQLINVLASPLELYIECKHGLDERQIK